MLDNFLSISGWTTNQFLAKKILPTGKQETPFLHCPLQIRKGPVTGPKPVTSPFLVNISIFLLSACPIC